MEIPKSNGSEFIDIGALKESLAQDDPNKIRFIKRAKDASEDNTVMTFFINYNKSLLDQRNRATSISK